MAFSYNSNDLDYLDAARRQREAYNSALNAQMNAQQAQNKQVNPLEAVLSGIANGVKNVGDTLYNMAGTGGAALRDLFTGNAGTGKYQNEWKDYAKKSIYGDENLSDKDYYLKSGGKAVDAAATVSDFIPGLGTGAKVALNVGQGIASGAVNPIIEYGSNASLEDILRGAAVGGAGAGVGQYVGGKLASKVPGTGRLSRIATSNLGRGALTGAASGAVAGGLNAGLTGNDILGGALQGAQSGGLGGATMAGAMGLAGKGIQKLNNKYGGATPDVTPTRLQDVVEDTTPTRRNIPITDYDAGDQKIGVRRNINVQYDGDNGQNVNVANRTTNIGRRQGSNIDGILSPDNEVKLPNTTKRYDKTALDVVNSGKLDDPISAFRKMGVPEGTIQKLINEAETYAADDRAIFDAYGLDGKSDLPMLNREQYYKDNLGQLAAKGGNGNIRAEDVEDYMYNHLRNDTGKNYLGGAQDDNWTILHNLFGDQSKDWTMDEMYDRYRQLASAQAREPLSAQNLSNALYGNPELNAEVTKEILNALHPTTKIDVAQNPGDYFPDKVNVRTSGQLIQDATPGRAQTTPTETQYTKRVLNPNPATPTVQDMPATEDVANANQSNLFGRALKNAGNDLQAAQTNITRAERRKFGIKDAGETVNQLRKRTGFSNIDDQAEFAKNITGSDGSIMDDVLRYNISKDENGQPLTLRQDQYVKAINDAVGKEWKKSVMGETYEQFRANLIDDIQNQDPITAANWLKKAAATQRAVAEGKGPTSDKAAQKARIYTEVANNIDDLTYSAVPQKNVNRMFEDTIDEFKTRAQEARASGNKKYATAYEKLAKELDGTERTIAAYRSFKKDFVKSSQLAEISRGAQSGSLEAGYKRGNVLGRVVNTIAEEPINRSLAYVGGKLSDLGDVANGASTIPAGKLAGKAGKMVNNAVNALNNDTLMNTSLGDVATRQIARQAGLNAMREQDNARDLQNANMEAQNALQDYYNATTQLEQAQAAPQQNAANNALDRISQALNAALMAGDVNAYSQLADLYKQAAAIYELQNPTATTSDAKVLNATQAKAISGLSQLQQLANMQPTARTALANSPLGGLVDLTGGDEYNAQADSLATTLGYLLSGANIKDSEIAAVKRDYIPSTFDSPTVRQQKLSRAEQLLRNYLADTNALTTL